MNLYEEVNAFIEQVHLFCLHRGDPTNSYEAAIQNALSGFFLETQVQFAKRLASPYSLMAYLYRNSIVN